MLISVSAIKLDGDTQVRKKLDQDQIEDFAQLMLTGTAFEDITVFNDGKNLWLADGFHRVLAAKMAGATEIGATVQVGSLEDARLYSYGANTRRGLSLSTEDKINILKKMEQHPLTKGWSNRQIAKHLNCSDVQIGRLKKRMIAVPDGIRRSKVVKNPFQDEQKAPEATIAPEVASPPSEDKQELLDAIDSLASENETLRDKISLGQYDGSEFEKIDLEERMDWMRKRITELELEVRTLTESRDYLQNRNAELLSAIKSLKSKLKKATNVSDRLDQAA
jgi:ParB-like chromosome segregation protein Spo0J